MSASDSVVTGTAYIWSSTETTLVAASLIRPWRTPVYSPRGAAVPSSMARATWS